MENEWVDCTLAKIGNSALNLEQAISLICSFEPGSWPPNWFDGNAKISKPGKTTNLPTVSTLDTNFVLACSDQASVLWQTFPDTGILDGTSTHIQPSYHFLCICCTALQVPCSYYGWTHCLPTKPTKKEENQHQGLKIEECNVAILLYISMPRIRKPNITFFFSPHQLEMPIENQYPYRRIHCMCRSKLHKNMSGNQKMLYQFHQT